MRGRLRAISRPSALPLPLTVRLLREDDASRLAVLMAQAYRGTIDDPQQDDAWFRADAEATISGTYGKVVSAASYVAIDDHTFAGTCLVTEDGPHLLLAFALVVPTWRNRGIGSALIAHSAEALVDLGHEEWTLAVTEGNPARALYERLGFSADPSLQR